jgi:hypothetical protein
VLCSIIPKPVGDKPEDSELSWAGNIGTITFTHMDFRKHFTMFLDICS